ncbi:MAG: L,D-transpeptidase [Gammaproteobacteria bacterium]|nr:MAG: L,D-transpeptidase [Gammaproteobacteria bacterium]
MKKIVSLIIGFVLIATTSLVNANDQVELLILRSKHQLIVKKEGVVLQTFKVAFGSGGKKAKLRSGDHTTPKGSYKISDVRTSDRFHLFIQLNYPNVNDATRALKEKLIDRDEFRAIIAAHHNGKLPPQNTALGGAIGIHGIGHETQDKIEIHQIADWTKGCIAMRNHEIEVLSRYIDTNTQIHIID